MLDKPTLEIDREKNEVTIKCNGDTIKFKDDNVEVTGASKNMIRVIWKPRRSGSDRSLLTMQRI